MPGAAASVGVLAVTAVLTVAFVTVGAGAATGQRLSGAADAAALAAADAASGAVSGVPCERAADLAAAHDATVTGCEIDGLVATVTVASRFVGLPVTATARAGPPP